MGVAAGDPLGDLELFDRTSVYSRTPARMLDCTASLTSPG